MDSALRLIAAGLVLAGLLEGQVCRLSVTGLNQARKVTGPVHAECTDEIVHSPPFGNWGVTSNYGQKGDSHQFDGWCQNTRTCNNAGTCLLSCTDGWYEWNSCTDDPLYQAPNCSHYNAGNCTEQVTATGVNVHGTKSVDIPVRCPSTATPGQGGCADVRAYSSGTNFMSLYELDPVTSDDLVQTLYFPETVVGLACDAWGCAPGLSPWVAPSAYDSPKSPGKAYAELATFIDWGAFVDEPNVCGVSRPLVTYVSAASYFGAVLAPGSIASAFGPGLSPVTDAAVALPLPTSIGGVSLRITDSQRGVHSAPLFMVSPGQVNLLVPPGVAAGPAVVSVYRGPLLMFAGYVQIDAIAPALFSANSDGRGVAAAFAVHVKPDGSQRRDFVFTPEAPPGSRTSTPIDMGDGDDMVFLELFGTGIRGRSGLSAVWATVAGVPAVVEYAGPQGDFEGLDQVNIRLPGETGLPRGEVDIVVSVDGRYANVVTVNLR